MISDYPKLFGLSHDLEFLKGYCSDSFHLTQNTWGSELLNSLVDGTHGIVSVNLLFTEIPFIVVLKGKRR
jgi:hypothetical protein